MKCGICQTSHYPGSMIYLRGGVYVCRGCFTEAKEAGRLELLDADNRRWEKAQTAADAAWEKNRLTL